MLFRPAGKRRSMKTELFYNPSGPWTRVVIDGNAVNPDDVYGFLYPVRHCLLQAWLYPSGSWQGLGRQLEELARGEALELVFHGRAVDYRDLKDALRGMDGIGIRLETSEDCLSGRQIAGVIRNLLAERVVVERDGGRETVRAWRELFPQVAGEIAAQLRQEQDWLQVIRDERDFKQALRGRGCCLVTSEYLTSYERLLKLQTLTRSLRRAQDMIVCQLDSAEAVEEYRDYAQNTLRLRTRFVAAAEEGWRGELMEKYGAPFAEQQSLAAGTACLKMLEACLDQKADLDARLRELRRRDADGAETQRLEYQQAGLRTLAHRLPAIREQLERAIHGYQEGST